MGHVSLRSSKHPAMSLGNAPVPEKEVGPGHCLQDTAQDEHMAALADVTMCHVATTANEPCVEPVHMSALGLHRVPI